MQRIFLYIVITVSLFALIVIVFEGKEDKQDISPVLDVGTGRIRDAAEVMSMPIQVTPNQEEAIGRKILTYFDFLPEGSEQVRFVQKVGNKLVRHCRRRDITYRFYVADTSMVNAFALPGGFIVITNGMLEFAYSEELAYIIGHELIHVEKKHSLIQMRAEMVKRKIKIGDANALADLTLALLRAGYSENMELESDIGGVILAHKAGYNPRAALAFIEAMLGPQPEKRQTRNPVAMGVQLTKEAISSYFASHPHWERRKQVIQETIDILK